MKNVVTFIIFVINVVIISCTLILTDSFQSVNASTNYTKYSNVTNGLTFEYPSSWIIEYVEANGPEIKLTNPDRHNGIIIGLPSKFSRTFLTEYPDLIQAATDVFGKMYGVSIIEPFDEKIVNGLPAVMGKLSGDVALETEIVKQTAQMALINYHGEIYSFQYYNIDSQFNSTESQDNMNRFILTFGISKNLSENVNESSQSLVYDNPRLGYTFKYPSDWTKEESRSGLTLIAPPPLPNETSINQNPESIAVTTETLFSDNSLEAYTESALGLLESEFLDFTLLNSSEATLSGYPAQQIEYTYTHEEGLELKNTQIWTIADNIVYAVTYGGTTEEFDSSVSVMEDVIDSFRITGRQ